MTPTRSPHISYLLLFVFILFAMPRLNMRVGPVPLYGIDVVAALMLYFASLTRQMGAKILMPFRSLILGIGFLVIVSEMSGIIYGSSVIDALYICMRYALAFSIAFSVPLLIQKTSDIDAMLKALSIALIITASLMIFSSLPMTRWIAILFFSISNLEPANAAQRFTEFGGTGGVRGRTLIGVSILSGTFISIGWPLVAYLQTIQFRLSAFWSWISTGAVMLSPMAITMAYSRQASIGLLMVLFAVLILPFGALRKHLLRPVLLSVAIVAIVGAGSSLFLLERFEKRFIAMFEDPLNDERESHRLLSYVAPFEHVVAHPQFLLIGAGSNNLRSNRFEIKSFEENHSLIAAGYFAHGMLSTLLLIFMIIAAYYYANWHRRRSRHLAIGARAWPRALYLAFLPILPMAAFAPALGTNIRAMYVYMFLIGLLACLRNPAIISDFQSSPESEST